MTAQEILTLVNAGYSKSDIEAFGEKLTVDNDAAAAADQAAAAEQTKEQETETAAYLQQVIEQNNKLLEQIKSMQAANVSGAESGKPEKPTADTIVRSFIENM